ncbi:MAG: EAL domain-containing protein [Wenzhouxiangellaceae bacterium]|nr:EAL domain-containing protein [Wenzhouxiangellaceae bacterium]
MNDSRTKAAMDSDEDLPEGLARVVRDQTFLAILDERCRKARKSGGSAFPPTVAWVVLDEMPTHRDQLGFTGLDSLMHAVHERLRVQLDPADVTARFGLDAIGIVMDAQGGDREREKDAQDLLRSVSSSLFEIDEHMIAATVSVALRPIQESMTKPESNLVLVARRAEKLSSLGGNRKELAAVDEAGAQAPGTMLGQLTKALRDDSLKIVYQPLLATSGSERERFQLLPRLIGADGSLIPAARFIPVAAERGVLPVLDNWMVANAIRQLADYRGEVEHIPQFFLNQSTALIEDPKFLAWLEKEIEPLERDRRSLVLEFNIMELKPRIREAKDVLAKLQSMGIGVSLTGIDEKIPEAVLLKHLPADFLRMKADFARRLLADEELALQFEAFAHDAREAGRRMIVPMLEDAEAVSKIWQMDVDLIQGNFIQQPSEAPEVTG